MTKAHLLGCRRRWRRSDGQATVELALVLPVLVMVTFAVVEVGMVTRAQVAADLGARSAARAIVVDPQADARAAVLAAVNLDGDRLRVQVAGSRQPATMVTVTVTYSRPVRLPLLGTITTTTITGRAAMLMEPG